MKKYIFKISAVLSFALLTQCSDSDNTIYNVLDNYTSGAILRTVAITSGEFNRFDTSTYFEVTIEEQDEQNGGLLEKVDVYLNFVDNSSGNGTTTKSEVLAQSIASSSFSNGEFGLPRTTIKITLAEVLSALSLSDSDYTGGDAISIRLLLTLTDGRTFTNSDSTGSLQGSFFSSPYIYSPVIKCIPTSPVSGEYTIDMADSYGDGWNGASIEVTINGTTTNYSIERGSSGNATFTVPEGASSFSMEYKSGAWDSEVTFTVTAPNGDLAYSDGPSPAANTPFVLSICL